MFDKSELNKIKQLYSQWKTHREQLYGEGEFTGFTDSDIKVKPVYTPLDIEGLNYEESGMPGEYPYTRGYSHLPYQHEPWLTLQAYQGFESAEETRKRREFIESKGETSGINLMPLDLPTDLGYDSDHPLARGKVGECGVAISTIDDLSNLIPAKDLEEKNNCPLTHNALPVIVAMIVVLAERRGMPLSKVRLDILGTRTWLTGHSRFPFAQTLRIYRSCRRSYEVRPFPR
jgi:methylmalonyl-CoA mutase N-terminal domain/subunit